MLKEDASHSLAAKQVQEEAAHHKGILKRNGIQHKILEKIPSEDGSIIIKIIKQYNTSSVGDHIK